MKFKKGDISIVYVITGAIAVVVLVVVFAFLFSFFTGRAFIFANLIPEFNNTGKIVEGSALIRYDISNRKVQYYDNVAWNDFFDSKHENDGEVKLDKKVIYYTLAQFEFEKYYYNVEKRTGEDISLDVLGIYVLKDLGLDKLDSNYINGEGRFNVHLDAKVAKVFNPKEFGSVTINLKQVNTNNFVPGYFTLIIYDELKYSYAGLQAANEGGFGEKEKTVDITSNNEAFSKMTEGAKKWRDSIFVYPVELTIWTGAKNEPRPSASYFCAKIFDKKFIVIDLNKPVGTDDKCSLNKN